MVRPKTKIRRFATLAAAATTTAALVSVPTAAHAQQDLTVKYPFTGTSHINATGSDIELGPGTLHSTIDSETAKVTANLEMPPAEGSFNALGFLPVTVTTTMIEETPTTGEIDRNTGAITTTSKITLQLSNLKIAGIPVLVGSQCKTKTPATINMASGDDWGVIQGGTLSGSYTIPEFENCLLATSMINLMVPGPDNTLTLNLDPAQAATAVVDKLARIG